MCVFFCAEFEDDPDLYVLRPIKYVGIEVWQVTYVTVFHKSFMWQIFNFQLSVLDFKFLLHNHDQFDHPVSLCEYFDVNLFFSWQLLHCLFCNNLNCRFCSNYR